MEEQLFERWMRSPRSPVILESRVEAFHFISHAEGHSTFLALRGQRLRREQFVSLCLDQKF
jgi:hypothetical protein